MFPILTYPVSYDYTKGKLPILVDIIIDSGAKLFVSAVGVPPKEVRTYLEADVKQGSNQYSRLSRSSTSTEFST